VLRSGDVVLLGSDGLWGPFSDRELIGAFSSGQVAEVLDGLITAAVERERGHSDNVTGVVVRWGEGEMTHATAEPVSHILDIP
jgi:serine/threonine protein phosphatase PrpC